MQLLACGHLWMGVSCISGDEHEEHCYLVEKALAQGGAHSEQLSGGHFPVHSEGDEHSFHRLQLHG